MNPDETKPISVFGVGFSIVLRSDNGRLILQDETDLTIIETNGDHWISERISWDRIQKLIIENNIISGICYDPMNETDEWVSFSYDLESKILTGGSYNRHSTIKKIE